MDKLLAIIAALVICQTSFSQDLEKKNIYYGNKAYDEKEFDEAILYYEEALKAAPLSFKSNFNMANAYFKKGDFQKASDLFASIIDLAPTAFDRSKVYHNLGNAHFMNQKLDDAINAYKESLKINPNDEDSRYNLAYALLLKNQQQQQNPEQNENDENGDNSENGNNGDNQNNSDNSDENGDGNNEKDENDPQNKDENDSDGNNGDERTEQEKASANRISKEQAKRILDSALKKEKEVQKKMERYKKVGSGESSKKDW